MNYGNLLELVKKNIDLNSYISQYSKIDGRGFASCPIHKETQASLKVYENKSWYCFGCNKGGSIVDFVMAIDNIPYKEAVKKLANYAGLDSKDYQPIITKFNKEKEVIRLMAKVKKWENILSMAEEQIQLACDIMNQEYKTLQNTPWETVDHSHYTKIHLNEQRFDDYCEQADIVINLMKKELEKWTSKLATAKKEK